MLMERPSDFVPGLYPGFPTLQVGNPANAIRFRLIQSTLCTRAAARQPQIPLPPHLVGDVPDDERRSRSNTAPVLGAPSLLVPLEGRRSSQHLPKRKNNFGAEPFFANSKPPAMPK